MSHSELYAKVGPKFEGSVAWPESCCCCLLMMTG